NDVEAEFRRLKALPPFCTLPTWSAGDTLKIIYHNVEGLASKFESTFADSTFSDADVVIFSEARDPITTNYDFERYGFRQANRIAGTGRHGSGTVVAVREYLEAEAIAPVIGGNVADREADGRASRIEICSVVVRGIFISGVYIFPNAAQKGIQRYLRLASLQATTHNDRPPIVMLGDFNSDFMRNRDLRLLTGTLRHYNLQIRTPTETPITDMRTQLDLVFAYLILNVQAMVYESVTFYHKPVHIDPATGATFTYLECMHWETRKVWENLLYVTSFLVLTFVLPMAFFTVSYGAIGRRLTAKRHWCRFKHTGGGGGNRNKTGNAGRNGGASGVPPFSVANSAGERASGTESNNGGGKVAAAESDNDKGESKKQKQEQLNQSKRMVGPFEASGRPDSVRKAGTATLYYPTYAGRRCGRHHRPSPARPAAKE
ncbi:hypothetical protein TYRP_023025, partial [Tyrophagus putrescentiae]